MICPACAADNHPGFEECFVCGKALFALTQGSVLAQRYEILRLVGQGGMGRVYEARDRVLEERVAIKVLRPQFAREPDMARRFLSEVRLARRITHTNVCRLHEYGESDGVRYLCMELVDGVNLKDVLRARRLPEDEAYAVALAASEGLAAVHAQDVIHRDFKTANIMIDARGQVKVMDFGIAKELGSESTGISLAGHVLGTPEYMSPEHAQGGRIDFRSDIYALGCVVFEIFTGRTIFPGGSAIETLRRHLYDPLPLDDETGTLLPEGLRPVLERALAKKAEDRYGSVRELIDELVAARESSPLSSVLDDAPAPPAVAPTRSAPRPSAPVPVMAPPVAPPKHPSGGDTRLLTSGARAVPRRSTWTWAVPALAVVALVSGVLALRGRGQPEIAAPAPATAAPVTPTPSPRTVEPSPEPVAASASIPSNPAATPPPSRPPLSTATVSRVVPSASVPTTTHTPAARTQVAALATPAPSPSVAPAAPETGVLSLLIVPQSETFVGEESLGMISTRALRLPPGEYSVRIVHPKYQPLQRKMTIRAGATTELVIDLSEKGVPK